MYVEVGSEVEVDVNGAWEGCFFAFFEEWLWDELFERELFGSGLEHFFVTLVGSWDSITLILEESGETERSEEGIERTPFKRREGLFGEIERSEVEDFFERIVGWSEMKSKN